MNFFYALFLGVFLSTSIFAASFDCKKATTKNEKIICSDSVISKLDEDLVKNYKQVKAFNPNIVADQRQWLASLKSCDDAACLKSKYEDRNSELENIIVRAQREEIQKDNSSNSQAQAENKKNTPPVVAVQEVVPLSRFYLSDGYWFMTNPELSIPNNQSCKHISKLANSSATFFRFKPSSRDFISKFKGSPDAVFSKNIKLKVFFNDKSILMVGVIEPIDKGTTVTTYEINNSENILHQTRQECLKCDIFFKPLDEGKYSYQWCVGEP